MKKMGAGDFTPAQIYKVLKDNGISLRGYRQGWSDAANDAFKRIGMGKGGPLPEVKRKNYKLKRTGAKR